MVVQISFFFRMNERTTGVTPHKTTVQLAGGASKLAGQPVSSLLSANERAIASQEEIWKIYLSHSLPWRRYKYEVPLELVIIGMDSQAGDAAAAYAGHQILLLSPWYRWPAAASAAASVQHEQLQRLRYQGREMDEARSVIGVRVLLPPSSSLT